MSLNARELAEGLKGQTIYTLDKQSPNTVIEIKGANVTVGTNESPKGKPVALRHIQDGLDVLYADGRIRITPKTFGGYRRSSFIGAFLGTLPNIRITPAPVWVELEGRDAADSTASGEVARSGGYPEPVRSAEVDLAGVDVALDAIAARFEGCEILPMPHNNPGYDVRVRDMEGVAIAYIEIKSTASRDPVFFVSERERLFAESHADRYHLLVVTSVDVENRKGHIHWRQGALEGDNIQLAPRQWHGRLV